MPKNLQNGLNQYLVLGVTMNLVFEQEIATDAVNLVSPTRAKTQSFNETAAIVQKTVRIK